VGPEPWDPDLTEWSRRTERRYHHAKYKTTNSENVFQVSRKAHYRSFRELVRPVYKLLHFRFPYDRIPFEGCPREPRWNIFYCFDRFNGPHNSVVARDSQGRKISTGQIPPAEAMLLDNNETHSSASKRNSSSLDLTS
jgi:hypothetical protein